MRVEYINHMGDDLEVVDAARVSFAKMSDWEYDSTGNYHSLKYDDAKLIKYLAEHGHWTPFAHTAIKLRMYAPVPIRTQCFKHKQGFVENEESRRYISSTPQVYYPTLFRNKPEGSVKQGSADMHHRTLFWHARYIESCDKAVSTYEAMIADGVCPEQARFVLPQGCEVQWIWTGNLYAFANFYNKRTDSHAQKEIRDLARMVGQIIEPLFPVSWKALTE